jgi:hypothetical protein
VTCEALDTGDPGARFGPANPRTRKPTSASAGRPPLWLARGPVGRRPPRTDPYLNPGTDHPPVPVRRKKRAFEAAVEVKRRVKTAARSSKIRWESRRSSQEIRPPKTGYFGHCRR